MQFLQNYTDGMSIIKPGTGDAPSVHPKAHVFADDLKKLRDMGRPLFAAHIPATSMSLPSLSLYALAQVTLASHNHHIIISSSPLPLP